MPISSPVSDAEKIPFIFKKNHSITFASQSHPEFFLMSSEILPPLLVWPAQNGTSAVSTNIPISLSVSGHGEHEFQHDIPSSDILQKPHRPISPWGFRNPGGISITPHQAYAVHPHLGEGASGTGTNAYRLYAVRIRFLDPLYHRPTGQTEQFCDLCRFPTRQNQQQASNADTDPCPGVSSRFPQQHLPGQRGIA